MEKLKQEILDYRDFFGGDIMWTDDIKKATTEKELAEILDRYHSHLEDVAIDAQRHLSNFKKELKLDLI